MKPFWVVTGMDSKGPLGPARAREGFGRGDTFGDHLQHLCFSPSHAVNEITEAEKKGGLKRQGLRRWMVWEEVTKGSGYAT